MGWNARFLWAVCAVLTAIFLTVNARLAVAGSAADIDRDVDSALERLYARSPAAKEVSTVAKGILVFPNVYKAGFIIGAQYGEGALRKGDKTAGYYNTAEGSFGLQAGVQGFGYALFFVNEAALGYLDDSAGFEIGVGPSITIVDAGVASSLTSSTLRDDIYAFIFNQKGLMAGIGLKGAKISKIEPDE